MRRLVRLHFCKRCLKHYGRHPGRPVWLINHRGTLHTHERVDPDRWNDSGWAMAPCGYITTFYRIAPERPSEVQSSHA